MKEQRLKKHILVFMLLSKIVVILFVLFHWQTGGYSTSEAMATIALIIPLFAVYLTVIVKDTLNKPYQEQQQETQKIKGTITLLTYTIFPLYLIIILYLISLKPQSGGFTFEHLHTAIALVESGLGIYIGQIVFALFRKEKSDTPNPKN